MSLNNPTSAYDLTGCYGQDWAQGILADHVGLAEAHGYRVVTLTRTRRLVTEDGLTWPVVCGSFVEVDTEDGPITGRCGVVATLDGECEAHAAQHAAWDELSEAERAYDERVREGAA